MVGYIPSDYWKGGTFALPYQAVAAEDQGWRNRKLDRLPLDPVGAAIRTVADTSLGDMLADDDLIRNGLWDRESHGGADELGDGENWDYDEVEDAWIAACQSRLSTYAITWNPDTGDVTLPADMTDETAAGIWQATLNTFGPWIDGIVNEARKGRDLAPVGDLRPATAPGYRWITEPHT